MRLSPSTRNDPPLFLPWLKNDKVIGVADEHDLDGRELPVIDGCHAGLWALSPGGIYFFPAEAPRLLRYFDDLATKQIRPILKWTSISVAVCRSPDGRWILYSLVGDVNSDIMMVDHFH